MDGDRDARRQRLGAALRENLRRRKAQARAQGEERAESRTDETLDTDETPRTDKMSPPPGDDEPRDHRR